MIAKLILGKSKIYTNTKTRRRVERLESDNNFTASLDRLMMASTAKTLLFGVIALVKHKFVDVFNRLDKKTYFRMLKQLCVEETNELAWISHFMRQIFNSNTKKVEKLIKQTIEGIGHFVCFLTPKGAVDWDDNIGGETSFRWLGGVI